MQSKMANGCTLFKYISDIGLHSEKEEEASMNESFCFPSEILPKLENSLQIIHSNEAYPNTCISDLPKIWSAICKITKRDLFAFRCLPVHEENSLWLTICFHTWKCVVSLLTEFCHSTWRYFGHLQNHPYLRIIVY